MEGWGWKIVQNWVTSYMDDPVVSPLLNLLYCNNFVKLFSNNFYNYFRPKLVTLRSANFALNEPTFWSVSNNKTFDVWNRRVDKNCFRKRRKKSCKTGNVLHPKRHFYSEKMDSLKWDLRSLLHKYRQS